MRQRRRGSEAQRKKPKEAFGIRYLIQSKGKMTESKSLANCSNIRINQREMLAY